MKLSTKKALALLCLLAFTLFLVRQAPLVHSSKVPSAKERALTFIEGVIQPDMSKYNVTLVDDIVGQPLIQTSETQESVTYHLDNNGSGPDIICLFINNVLTSAGLSVNAAFVHSPSAEESLTLLYRNPSTNLTDETIGLLERYQTYTIENLSDMIAALANVDATQNVTKTSGDIKLTVQNIPLETTISLKYTFNDTEYTGVSFTFRNGQFYSFMDDRSRWVIGNTDVNIDKSQAIDIAKRYAESYSYTLDNGVAVKGFNVTSIQAATNFYPRDNSTTIYPYWSVQLNLDKVYPGNVWQLSVGIWADSGTVFLCQPIGFGGGGSPTGTQTPASSQQPQSGIPSVDLVIVAVVAAAVAIISILAIRRQRK